MRRTTSRLIVGVAATAALLIPAGASSDQLPAGAEGCIVGGAEANTPAGWLSHASQCTYTATRTGGYVAGGQWTMSVTVGNVTTTYGPANAPKMGCTLWGPGAVVSVSIPAPGNVIAAGNPYPSPTDGVRPPSQC